MVLTCCRWVQVLDFELQRQLVPYMKDLTPLPGIYDQDFIAANQASDLGSEYHMCCGGSLSMGEVGSCNLYVYSRCMMLTWLMSSPQEERANNLIKGTKSEQVETVRRQIREFKESSGVDKVIVLWTANTERFAQVLASLASRCYCGCMPNP